MKKHSASAQFPSLSTDLTRSCETSPPAADRRFSLVLPVLLAAVMLAPQQGKAQFSPGPNPITGTVNNSQTLASGTGTINAGATLSVGGSANAVNVTGSSTLVNNGTINQTGNGRAIRNSSGSGLSFVINNNAGALVQAADSDAFQMNQANNGVRLENYGTFNSLNASAGGAQAIDWSAITTGVNILNNYAGGLLQASAADAVRPGVNGVVNNFGQIKALPTTQGSLGSRDASSSDGIDGQFNSGITIYNTGSISGRHGITGGETAANYVISVNNDVGGTLTGLNGAGINIDGAVSSAAAAAANIVNKGTIIGNYDNTKYDIGDGDGVDVDGKVNLDNFGVIRGKGAAGAGNNSEGVSIGGGSIINRAGAEITGENTSGSGAEGHGILADDSNGGSAFFATTVNNSGLIRGFSGYAIKMVGNFNNSIDNNAGGTIRGAGSGAAIQTGNGSDTINNSGAIVGDNGLAIDMQGGNNTLNILGGAASVAGNIAGGSGGVNTMNIDPGTGNSFSYGHSISQFNAVYVKSGTVAFTGANAYTGATVVQGGKLIAGAAGALGNTSGITVNNGAILALAGTGNRINDAATVALNGGKLDVGGLSESLGTLNVTGPSIVDLGSGELILQFADSSALSSSWNGGLSIYNWSGNTSGGGLDRVLFGSTLFGLIASQLSQIGFFSGDGTGFLGYATILSNGEIVPMSAVPEAKMVLPSLLLCGLAFVLGERRRITACFCRA